MNLDKIKYDAFNDELEKIALRNKGKNARQNVAINEQISALKNTNNMQQIVPEQAAAHTRQYTPPPTQAQRPAAPAQRPVVRAPSPTVTTPANTTIQHPAGTMVRRPVAPNAVVPAATPVAPAPVAASPAPVAPAPIQQQKKAPLRTRRVANTPAPAPMAPPVSPASQPVQKRPRTRRVVNAPVTGPAVPPVTPPANPVNPPVQKQPITKTKTRIRTNTKTQPVVPRGRLGRLLGIGLGVGAAGVGLGLAGNAIVRSQNAQPSGQNY